MTFVFNLDDSPSTSFQEEDSRKRKYGAGDLLEAPVNADPKRFFGHRNCQTVKSVNFLGPNSEYVVSGSDDSHIYVWDKDTQKIVQWLQGDDAGVVSLRFIEVVVIAPCPFQLTLISQ